MGSDNGFIPLTEFAGLYGPVLSKKELVTLVGRDGPRMWQRDKDGWYRLEDEPRDS